MSNTDYIINLCHDIHLKGKTPSVALVRNAASMPLPIPDVIKAIKHWKANPDYRPSPSITEPPKTSVTPTSLEQRVYLLEEQLKELVNELALLKDKVN